MLKFLKGIVRGIIDLKEETQQLTGDYKVTDTIADKIKKFEGYSDKAYQDAVGVWTIGYGNTFYEDGSLVKSGDTLTRAEGEKLFRTVLDQFSAKVADVIRVDVNQCQFDALVCFTYNIGIGALKKSTLLKKINSNPNNPDIAYEFTRWVKAGGKTYAGLVKRRREESDYYFSQNCK